MRIGAVVDDLMLFSRIDAAAHDADAELVRVSDPNDLPADLDLILVDWSADRAPWAAELVRRREAGARVIAFGRHTDLDAHAAARTGGIGPMWARSRLVAQLPTIARGAGKRPRDEDAGRA